jgi:N-acetylglucosamine kinase-like BadF-type ATPase
MILIADGGSTKVDWIALDKNKKEIFRIRTKGLNPVILSDNKLANRIFENFELTKIKDKVSQIYFYGAGCGTPRPTLLLTKVFKSIFPNAKISIKEDLLAAVYASSAGNEAIVCILGTGSNSCYFDGNKVYVNVVSLGYILMDEASGNYFGKKLITDYYYHKMPKEIAQIFAASYDLSPDVVKQNLYQKESANAYLGDFAEFMFQFKDEAYMHKIIKEGFISFFENRIIPYKKPNTVPIYFIGSIAFFFEPILKQVAKDFGLKIKGIIRRPIDNLIAYHKKTSI